MDLNREKRGRQSCWVFSWPAGSRAGTYTCLYRQRTIGKERREVAARGKGIEQEEKGQVGVLLLLVAN